MTDDIVNRLEDLLSRRRLAWEDDEIIWGAIDEIKRLRQLGDSLAFHVRNDNAKEMYDAVHQWEEARRD